MKLPYRLRLVTLINNEWVELVRFVRSYTPQDINFHTRNLSGPWRMERPLRDKECLSSRPAAPIYL